MREKIAKELYGFDNLGPSPLQEHERKVYRAKADKLLEAICEEIGKELDGREEDMIANMDYSEGWRDCRHWVLSLLKGGEKQQ